MSTASPLVSIVIPCHNQAAFLAEAIESALEQTHAPIEVVVVDDGSTDRTPEVASGYPGVVLVSQPNLGPASARNAGLRRSAGAYVIFLDADDRLRRHAAATGLHQLARHSHAACCFGRCAVIARDGTPLATVHAPPLGPDRYAAFLRHNPIRMPALALHRRQALEEVGAFDPRRSASADYDLYLRLARRFPLIEHDAVVAEYRRHEDSMSVDAALMLTSTLAVLRAQRRHVRPSLELRCAYRDGLRFWRELYGDAVMKRVRADLRAARWGRALAALLVLTRQCPGLCAREVWRRLRRSADPRRGSGIQAPGSGLR